MAIQLPNPGLGDGQTGDNEYVMWTKVKDNFSNSAHAASKLVGAANGQIPLYEQVSSAVGANLVVHSPSGSGYNLDDLQGGTYAYIGVGAENFPQGVSASLVKTEYVRGAANLEYLIQSVYSRTTGERFFRAKDNSVWSAWQREYHTGNTLIEEGTGHLYTSSPVILLRDGVMDKMHEAEDMDCELIKNGTGDYTLKNTTGLRDNEWHAVPPKDVHGNPLCMIVVTEPSEGEVNVKTYKRKFDFEKAAVVADLEQPFDIPSGSSVRLHFNDLPEEQLDEPIE